MTKIRLKREGRHKKPYYHIVVGDSRKKTPKHWIGTYDPLIKGEFENKFKIDMIEYDKWISCGAQPTDIVVKFISKVRSKEI